MEPDMNLTPRLLQGRFFDLEPLAPEHEADMREAMDRDAERWDILYTSGMGAHFPSHWQGMIDTPRRFSFAARHKGSGRIAGTSAFIGVDARNHSTEIGGTWFHPDFRGTALNPEAKYMMLRHAFEAGAYRCSFTVDARNLHSQAAVAKLGAVREGLMRRHLVTWTGHKRDSVLFSITDEDWPAVKERLEERLAAFQG